MFHTFSASVRHTPFPWLEVYENHMAIIYLFYNHFKVKNIRMVRTLLLSTSPILKKAQPMWRKWLCHKKLHVHDQYELLSRSSCLARLYNLCQSFNIINRYITGDHMLKLSHIFLGLISSMFVSGIYALIRRISCLICIGPYCIVTVPLAQHHVITNRPLYIISYFYAVWLLSMTLSPTL